VIHRKKIRSKYRWKYPKRLLKIDELSEMIGISVSTIYTWVSEERIPVHKLGRAVRFDPVEIESWLKEKKRDARKRW
jgi:excisionase family DNA binding protein